MNNKKVFFSVVAVFSGAVSYLIYSWILGCLKILFLESPGVIYGILLMIFYLFLYIFFSLFFISLVKLFWNLKPLDIHVNKGLTGGMITGFWVCFWMNPLGLIFLLLSEYIFPEVKFYSEWGIIYLNLTFLYGFFFGLIIGLKNELNKPIKNRRQSWVN